MIVEATGYVGTLIGDWAAGKGLNWLADHLNQPSLEKNIQDTLKKRMQEDDVPKNLRFNEKDLNFTETKDTPGDSIGKIIKLIESKTVPQESLWFEALMARWAQISAQESTQKAVPQFYQSAEKTGA